MNAMPIGDQRGLVVKVRGSEGQTARGYWTGGFWADADLRDGLKREGIASDPPLSFQPKEWLDNPTTDLRQGVTPSVHAILDRLDALRLIGHKSQEPRVLHLGALAASKRALDATQPTALRRFDAIDAAARMLLMAEQLEPELSR